MSDKLQDAVKMLREYCGGIPLSNAIIYTINNNIYMMETINKLREENNNCKAQYQHWDEKYSEALIKMREMKEEIERLKFERDYIKMKYDMFKNTVQAMLPDETVKAIYFEFTKRMNEWISEQVYKQIEPLFNKEES